MTKINWLMNKTDEELIALSNMLTTQRCKIDQRIMDAREAESNALKALQDIRIDTLSVMAELERRNVE